MIANAVFVFSQWTQLLKTVSSLTFPNFAEQPPILCVLCLLLRFSWVNKRLCLLHINGKHPKALTSSTQESARPKSKLSHLALWENLPLGKRRDFLPWEFRGSIQTFLAFPIPTLFCSRLGCTHALFREFASLVHEHPTYDVTMIFQQVHNYFAEQGNVQRDSASENRFRTSFVVTTTKNKNKSRTKTLFEETMPYYVQLPVPLLFDLYRAPRPSKGRRGRQSAQVWAIDQNEKQKFEIRRSWQRTQTSNLTFHPSFPTWLPIIFVPQWKLTSLIHSGTCAYAHTKTLRLDYGRIPPHHFPPIEARTSKRSLPRSSQELCSPLEEMSTNRVLG